MCPKLEPYYTWKVGGGLKGVDISMLSLPRQQSKMRITWVSTGTPCKSKICLKILIKGYRMLEVYMFFRVFLSEYYHSFVTTYCCENNKTPVHKCPFNLNFKIDDKTLQMVCMISSLNILLPLLSIRTSPPTLMFPTDPEKTSVSSYSWWTALDSKGECPGYEIFLLKIKL